MVRPSTGVVLCISWMSPRVMSGRSWSMALSMLAMRVMVSRRAAPLLCSTRRSDSRWMVRMVEIPKPTMRTITMSTVILMVREAAGSFMGARLGLASGGGSNPDRAAGPVGLAEHALEELARRIAREVLVKGDLAWDLVTGDMAPGEGHDVLCGEPDPRLELHGRVDPLAPVVVGHAEDRHVLDVGVAVQGVLDLRGIDVHAGRDDHVALAVADIVEAVGIHPRDVAHRVPLAATHLPGRLGVLVVLVEDVGETLDVELARLAHGQGPAVVVEERDLPARGGLPARSGLPEDVLRSEDGVHRQLGRAVELVESRPEVGDHRLLDAHGTGRRGHDDGSHGGYVVAGPDGCRQLHDALEERGRHEGARAAMALDLLEGALGVELGHDHHRRPDQVRVEGKA